MTEKLVTGGQTADAVTAERFAFGENWRRFLAVLDDERIREAENSLAHMLGVSSLEGKRFLDAGSGSGLFSLAAYRLGADAVRSFDFDPSSVGCTLELRRRYGDEARWTVERGDLLDADYLSALGRWDVVYSWGVLHHTGDMWRALDNVVGTVDEGGQLFISIYNDQGPRSRAWRVVKRVYNRLPAGLRTPYAVAVMGPREALKFAVLAASGNPQAYVQSWTQYKRSRGMSRSHDLLDWVGGYPFEVATPERIFDVVHERGFALERMTTTRSTGCNQFLFARSRTEAGRI
jgi:2-polyprenyl-6-hydroxyphenyl methylase/3-demethylubiquinone-9 3-methyltransferase